MARGKFKKTAGFKKKVGFRRKKRASYGQVKESYSRVATNKIQHFKTGNNPEERNSTKETKPSDRTRQDMIDSTSSEEETDFVQLLSTFTDVGNVKLLAVESEDNATSSEEDVDLARVSKDEEMANFRQRTTNYNISGIGRSSGEDRSTDVPNVNILEVAHGDEDDYQSNYSEDEEEQGSVEGEDENRNEHSNEDINVMDPFVSHFNFELDSSLLEAVTVEPPHMVTTQAKWPVLGNVKAALPFPIEQCASDKSVKGSISIIEEKTFARPGTVPKIIEDGHWSKYYVKSQIHSNLSKANYHNMKRNETEETVSFTPLQRELFSVIFKYQDLYFPERSFQNCDQIRFVYCLHAVNHILKTRSKIIHHNAKVLKKQDVPDEYRDQGLVRPKVLILVPFRHSALRIVQMMISILLSDEKANVINKSRFFEEFSGEDIIMPKKNPKPEDYELTFAGNTDDTFRIGISITKKSLKLYADFYSADIIVASPLGLRVIIGADGETERDFDFLASIEVLVLDQTEIFLMQNWDHLLHVMNHLHLQPRTTHGTDFSRVYMWAINGWTRFYRQSLIFSAVNLPEILSIYSHQCCNYTGRIVVDNSPTTGAVSAVVVQVPQVFNKFSASSPLDEIEVRFEHFVKKIVPQYRDSIMNHTLVYVPSYFDFVKIRNFFKAEDVSFVQICEYSKEGKVARARDMFFHSDAHFLLYSERLHFFRRLRIKGIRHIIFYQLPTLSHFYSEMCNLMQEANQNHEGGNESNMTVTVLYSKYDAQRLASVVGFDRAVRMISSQKSVQMLLTGD